MLSSTTLYWLENCPSKWSSNLLYKAGTMINIMVPETIQREKQTQTNMANHVRDQVPNKMSEKIRVHKLTQKDKEKH